MAKWSSIRPSAAVVKIVGLGWVLFAAAPAKAQLQNLYPDFFEPPTQRTGCAHIWRRIWE